MPIFFFCWKDRGPAGQRLTETTQAEPGAHLAPACLLYLQVTIALLGRWEQGQCQLALDLFLSFLFSRPMQPKDVTARAQGLPYMCSVVSCHPGDQCQPGADINHNEHDMFLSSIVSMKGTERSKPLNMRKIELTFLSIHSAWG